MDHSTDLHRNTGKLEYHRIAETLRREIVSGKRLPGTKLPSTGELATAWKSTSSTVHTALVTLVKEGWILRVNGAGTYVAHPDNRFLSAGIYHASDICDNGFPPFSRSLHMSLLKQFKQLGKETQIFIDTRPRRQQGKLLPALEEAILERRIQCVVAPTLNPHSLPPLARLRIPTAFLSGAAGPNRVNFDIDDLLRESARRFKAQGCRTVGVMSTISRSRPGETNPTFYSQFEKAMHAEGLVTRDAWNSKHTHNVRDHESHGYAEFLRFWRLKEKPDGLLVIPDTMARGVITAILQLGMQTITPKMRFIFHRNAQVNLLCPFPVTWAISDETIWAEWLIRIIQKQFSGEKVTPVLLPYCFEEDAAPARG